MPNRFPEFNAARPFPMSVFCPKATEIDDEAEAREYLDRVVECMVRRFGYSAIEAEANAKSQIDYYARMSSDAAMERVRRCFRTQERTR